MQPLCYGTRQIPTGQYKNFVTPPHYSICDLKVINPFHSDTIYHLFPMMITSSLFCVSNQECHYLLPGIWNFLSTCLVIDISLARVRNHAIRGTQCKVQFNRPLLAVNWFSYCVFCSSFPFNCFCSCFLDEQRLPQTPSIPRCRF